MRIRFQTEETLNSKEVEGSAAENLKCLYLCMGYFVQPEIFYLVISRNSCAFHTVQSGVGTAEGEGEGTEAQAQGAQGALRDFVHSS